MFSTSGGVQYIGRYHEYIGGYHEYIRGVGDIMMNVGGYHEYIGGVQNIGRTPSGGYHEYIIACSVHRRIA